MTIQQDWATKEFESELRKRGQHAKIDWEESNKDIHAFWCLKWKKSLPKPNAYITYVRNVGGPWHYSGDFISLARNRDFSPVTGYHTNISAVAIVRLMVENASQ